MTDKEREELAKEIGAGLFPKQEIIVNMPLSLLKENEKVFKQALRIIKSLIESPYVSEDGHFLDVGKDNFDSAVAFVELHEDILND